MNSSRNLAQSAGVRVIYETETDGILVGASLGSFTEYPLQTTLNWRIRSGLCKSQAAV